MRKLKYIIYIFVISTASLLLVAAFPTKDFAKFVVKNNSEYFVLGINKNRYRNLYYDFLTQRYFRNNFLLNIDNLNTIRERTKEFLVDQDESEFYKFNIPMYSGISLGASIIRGFGFCDSVNGILGLRLSNDYRNIELLSLYDTKNNSSPHTLLKLVKNDHITYMDIYGYKRNIHYAFEPEIAKFQNVEIFKKSYYQSHGFSEDSIKKIYFDEGFVLRKFSLFDYFYRTTRKLFYSIFHKSPPLQAEILNKKTEPASFNISPGENFYELIDLFIEARFNEIEGNYHLAKESYTKILESGCSYDFCKVVRVKHLKELEA